MLRLATVLLALLAPIGLGACSNRCEPSSKVLLSLEGNVAALANATTLRVLLTVDSDPVQPFDLPLTPPVKVGATVLLEPLTGKDLKDLTKYSLALQISTLDANGVVLGQGASRVAVDSTICNTASVALSP